MSVVVIDSGRGISNEQLRQLFREGKEQKAPNFSDNESSEAKDLRYESYGLGLFIVKAISERLSASVLVQSKVGVGSSFQILLPKEQAPHVGQGVGQGLGQSASLDKKVNRSKHDISEKPDPAAQSPSKPESKALVGSTLQSAALQGLSVLLIDDDSAILLALNKLLQAWGATVTQETNPRAAQARLSSENNFDVVICDFDLGKGKNGLELLRIAALAQPDAKRILMSGRPKTVVLAAQNDHDLLWLSKPIDVAVLFEALQQALVQTRPVGYSK